MTKFFYRFTSKLNLAIKQNTPIIKCEYSRLVVQVLEILVKLGYIKHFCIFNNLNKTYINIYIRFTEFGIPALRTLANLSTPGKRVYLTYHQLRNLKSLNNVAIQKDYTLIISTSKGLFSASAAIQNKVGGEALLLLL